MACSGRAGVTLAALVMLLSNMLGECGGETYWWFPGIRGNPPPTGPSIPTTPSVCPPQSSPGSSRNPSTGTPPPPMSSAPPPPNPPPSTSIPPTSPVNPPSTRFPPTLPPTPGIPPTPAPSSPPSPAPSSPPITGNIPTTGPAASPLPSTAPPTTGPTTAGTNYIVVSPASGISPDHTIFTSVQDAIDAVPENNTDLVTIAILSGTYTEKVSVPSTKPFITLQGSGRDTTIITYNDTANSTGSTVKSATFTVLADNFSAYNITFQNSARHARAGESGAQAVAFRLSGDMAAFYGCGFVSSQDTLCDQEGRHYFRDCYIEGNIDIIWGNGQSLYEYCEIKSTADNTTGSITAQGRASDDESTGFVFVGGSIRGTGHILLGRAYGLYSRVVFTETYMESMINPLGWSDWPTITRTSTSFSAASSSLVSDSSRHEYYGEYGNTGPGANTTSRVSWMKKLTKAQAANFANLSFIDGSFWLTSET